jgi:hypothetical protein
MTRGVRGSGPTWDVLRRRTVERGLLNERTYLLRFTYSLGPYIEVWWQGSPVAFEVINVWDYDQNSSTITNREEFSAAVDKWLESHTGEDLRTYWENT